MFLMSTRILDVNYIEKWLPELGLKEIYKEASR